ncbi:MAG: choice-of-anchor D domain-containing protein [Terriglobales bacterium]
MGFAFIPTQADAQPLFSWPSSLHFGDVSVGQTETQLVTVTNDTSESVTITGIGIANSEFSVVPMSLPLILAAGQSTDIGVIFAPTATGWAGGTISFVASPPSHNIVIQAMGTGVASAALTASPGNIAFGTVGVGGNLTIPVTVTNNRSWQVAVSAFQTQGGAFSVSGPASPLALAAGQSVTLNVTFTPQSAGQTYGTVTLVGSGLVIPFSGAGTATAAGQLMVSPASVNFGNVAMGATGVQSTILTASGGSVTVSGANSSSAQFELQGAAFPFTIAAGQSISMNVAFTPQTSGAASGMLSFTSNAANSSATASLAGTGTAPTVNLSWSPTPEATGYNVYRCVTASCTYAKVNASVDPDVTFADSTVAAGQTYSYVATSVTSDGQESGYSTPVEVAVP